MSKLVSDLTSKDVGQRMRVQTDDGAYIEGTITKLTHALIRDLVHIHIEFDELYVLDDRGNRVHYPVRTWGNRTATEVEE